MHSVSDHNILDRLKSEEGASFELLYEFYFPSIAAYIKLNSGNYEDAEDIFQETIIVLLHKVRQPDFFLTSSLNTYLYTIAKNLWLKKLRDNKIKVVEDEFNITKYVADNDIFEIEPEKSNAEKIQNWLRKITQNCRNILKDLFFYGVPMNDLMAKMGWKNKHTASNQKHKCIQQIKKVKDKETE